MRHIGSNTLMKRGPSVLGAALEQLDRAHLRRERRTIDGFVETGSRVTTVVDGRQLSTFPATTTWARASPCCLLRR